MAKREFKPGHRASPQLRGTGKMSEERFAWLRTALGQLVIMKYPPDEEDLEQGPTVTLYLPRPNARDVSLNLTALTAEELALTEEFFNLLFAEARPIVAERDRIAHEALRTGDDSNSRVYRTVPQFIVRERARRQNRESILNGPQDPPPGDGGSRDPDVRVRDDSDALADGEPTEAGGQDDGTEAY